MDARTRRGRALAEAALISGKRWTLARGGAAPSRKRTHPQRSKRWTLARGGAAPSRKLLSSLASDGRSHAAARARAEAALISGKRWTLARGRAGCWQSCFHFQVP